MRVSEIAYIFAAAALQRLLLRAIPRPIEYTCEVENNVRNLCLEVVNYSTIDSNV